MFIDEDGWLEDARFIPSPNHDERPKNESIHLLVIHNICLPPDDFTGNGVIELFTNRIDPDEHPYYQTLIGLKVSAHFFIRRDGTIIQFVSCNKRAWHAGQSCWKGKERCNDFSIGIELEGSDTVDFTPQQYAQLIALTQSLRQRYPIQHISGQCPIAPERKTDPGPCFDWQRYLSEL